MMKSQLVLNKIKIKFKINNILIRMMKNQQVEVKIFHMMNYQQVVINKTIMLIPMMKNQQGGSQKIINFQMNTPLNKRFKNKVRVNKEKIDNLKMIKILLILHRFQKQIRLKNREILVKKNKICKKEQSMILERRPWLIKIKKSY